MVSDLDVALCIHTPEMFVPVVRDTVGNMNETAVTGKI